MTDLPLNFPYGKSIWIWQLWACVGKKSIVEVAPEDYQKVIEKCKANDIQIVLIKSGDGEDTWDQFTPELIKQFHAAGLKVFSWSFVYGKNPEREAAIAMWSLDMGSDAHVFDAEEQYEHITNPGAAATTMLQLVRSHAPNALLGHSPAPIIDFHQNFPYVEFGKYCDFVMPQVYFGEWNKTPTQGVDWVFTQWSKWEAHWKEAGFGESIKPIIPVCQCYDDYSKEPNFILTPGMIREFVKDVEGYRAVSFYEYAHILRDDCWEAIKDSKVWEKIVPEQAVSEPSIPSSTLEAVVITPVVPMQTPEGEGSPHNEGEALQNAVPDHGTMTATKEEKTISILPQTIPLSAKGHTTIIVKKDEACSNGVEIKVIHHIPHALIVKYFLIALFHGVRVFFKTLLGKGGEHKK